MDPNEEDEVSHAASATTSKKTTPNYPGPKPGVHYPLTVIYCGGKFHFVNMEFIRILSLEIYNDN